MTEIGINGSLRMEADSACFSFSIRLLLMKLSQLATMILDESGPLAVSRLDICGKGFFSFFWCHKKKVNLAIWTPHNMY